MKNTNNFVCNPNCSYFPDMEVPAGEWVYDDKIPFVKRRKDQKKFCCLYDGHVIDWEKCNLPNKKTGEEV